MQTIRKHRTVILLLLVVLLPAAWMSFTYGQESSRRYEYVVGPQKSDMQRMIEAYEKLSSQYLTVVQQNLALMAQQDQQILNKLTGMEKKIDQLNTQVSELKKQLAQNQTTEHVTQ